MSIQPGQEETRVLHVDNLSFRFRGKRDDLFTSLSFAIERGERVALAGPNGVGKSTLLRVLLDECQGEGRRSGTAYFWGSTFRRNASRVGLVGDLKASEDYHGLPHGYPVESLVAMQEELSGYAGSEAMRGFYSILKMEAMMARRTDQLSSGQRKRLQLFFALAKRPDLILADEPFENVDVDRARVMPMLRDFLTQHGSALLLITHRREEAEFLCDSLYDFKADGCEPRKRRPVSVAVSFCDGPEVKAFHAGGPADMAWRLQMELEKRPGSEAKVTVKYLEGKSEAACLEF